MSGREIYDVSVTERKILEARAARRMKLRHQYLEQIGNPYRMATGEGGTVFDSGLQRFISMRATVTEYFKTTPKAVLFLFGAYLIPTLSTMYIIISKKNKTERKYRSGQVSYRDREFKFR